MTKYNYYIKLTKLVKFLIIFMYQSFILLLYHNSHRNKKKIYNLYFGSDKKICYKVFPTKSSSNKCC
jgi:hypothetical protein